MQDCLNLMDLELDGVNWGHVKRKTGACLPLLSVVGRDAIFPMGLKGRRKGLPAIPNSTSHTTFPGLPSAPSLTSSASFIFNKSLITLSSLRPSSFSMPSIFAVRWW